MDLYEALKSGTSSEELETAFRADLEKAKARLEQEKEAETKKAQLENLAKARDEFAFAIVTYFNALLLNKANATVSIEEIQAVKDILAPFEEEMNAVKCLYNNSKETTKKQERTDDEVIQNFLKTLL